MRLMSAFRRTSSVASGYDSVDEQVSDLELPSEIGIDDPILGMAIRNEELRQEFGGLIDQLHQIDILKAKFAAVLSRFSAVVDELEASRRESSEFRTSYEIEITRTEELREVINRLEPEIAALTEAKAGLIAQVKQLTARAEGVESDFEREKANRRDTADALSMRLEELQLARTQISALEDEMSTARIELDRLSGLLASRDVEIEQTLSGLQHSEEQERLLKALLDESTSQNARLSRQVSELEPVVERFKAQLSQLQTALEAERHAKEQASIDRIEALEMLRVELKGTGAKLEAALARADAHERMLNDTRSNYREKLEELRGSERRAIDLAMQLANAQRRSEAAEKESEAAHAKLSALETERRQYNAHIDTLTKAISERESEIVLANDRTTFVSARLEESQRNARAERERFEADMVAVTQLFDKERVDRTLLEGALQSARRHSQSLSRELYDGEEMIEAVAANTEESVAPDDAPMMAVTSDASTPSGISFLEASDVSGEEIHVTDSEGESAVDEVPIPTDAEAPAKKKGKAGSPTPD